jgi:hypothetical protein
MKFFIASITMATISVVAMANPTAKSAVGECIKWQSRDGSTLVDRSGNPVLSRFDANGRSGCTVPKQSR